MRRSARIRWMVLGLLLGTAGCLLQNLSKEENLRDAVTELNDDLRWGRVQAASRLVTPTYRSTFRAAHHRLGREIQVGDAEILAVKLYGGKSKAYSIVDMHWYANSAMSLRRTRLRQRWHRKGGHYLLAEEEVVDGDPGFLAPAGKQTTKTHTTRTTRQRL